MENLDGFLKKIGVTKKQINYLAFGRNDKNKIYHKYEIPKYKGGTRIILEPTPVLKGIQRFILDNILYPYWSNYKEFSVKDCCIGFQKGKSVVDNAMPHKNKKIVLKFDIKNYFGTISQNRVFGFFYKKLKYDYDLSNVMAGLCVYDNELPQGAPTSPILANIITINLDARVVKLISRIKKQKNIDISYTRYADDLSFSFSEKIDDKNLNKFIGIIFKIIEEEGFLVNFGKFRILYSGVKQRITGVIVNDKLSLGRKNFKNLKSIVYNINKNGWEFELDRWNNNIQKIKLDNVLKGRNFGDKIRKNLTLDEFKDKINGYIAYYSMINNTYTKYLTINK